MPHSHLHFRRPSVILGPVLRRSPEVAAKQPPPELTERAKFFARLRSRPPVGPAKFEYDPNEPVSPNEITRRLSPEESARIVAALDAKNSSASK